MQESTARSVRRQEGRRPTRFVSERCPDPATRARLADLPRTLLSPGPVTRQQTASERRRRVGRELRGAGAGRAPVPRLRRGPRRSDPPARYPWRRAASAASCVREGRGGEGRWSVANRCTTRVCTVRRATYSLSPIWGWTIPRATRSTTAGSLGIRVCEPLARHGAVQGGRGPHQGRSSGIRVRTPILAHRSRQSLRVSSALARSPSASSGGACGHADESAR